MTKKLRPSLAIINLIFLITFIGSHTAFATVLQIKEAGKPVKDIFLSTNTHLPLCEMKGHVIDECFFNLKIYSCKDQLRVHSLDLSYRKNSSKRNLITNITLSKREELHKNFRLIKSFELENSVLVEFGRHFPLGPINTSSFKCEITGDLANLLKAKLECHSEGAIDLRFEESTDNVDLSKWCAKPFIVE